jgi:predicted ABC-type ATPase
MAYLWLDRLELSFRRIRQRVRKGGHDVSPATVQRRRLPSIRNFFHLYLPLADEALLFDASGANPNLVARFAGGEVTILHPNLYEKIRAEGE